MIYMDNHATTRVDDRVMEAMGPYFTDYYGNPGSVGHRFGEQAREAVDESRQSIGAAIGAEAREIVFTSGATESNNLAIFGVAERARRRGDHLISVVTEHKGVLDPLARLAKRGYDITLLEVEQTPHPWAGRIDPQQVADAIRDETSLVSVMLANNEIGTIQPLAQIGAICKERGVLLHCDATQAVGKIPVDVGQLEVDLMSFSAHKIYGPKGIGALYVRRRNPIVRLDAQIFGGGQQEGRRSGTLNVPGIVGLATALRLCLEELPSEMQRLATLRDALMTGIQEQVPNVQLCGPSLGLGMPYDDDGPRRLPGNLNLTFGDVDGEALLLAMGNLAVSSGASCTSVDPEPSHVLQALGLPEDAARSSLRFGLGRFNRADEVSLAVETVSQAVQKLRQLASHD